jgi:hypothetical protein
VFENNPDNIEFKIDEAINFVDISENAFHIKLYRNKDYLKETNDALERMTDLNNCKNYYKSIHSDLTAKIDPIGQDIDNKKDIEKTKVTKTAQK